MWKSSNKYIPAGIDLSHTLLSFLGQIEHFAWSPDGRILALSFTDKTIRLWNIERKTQSASSLCFDPSIHFRNFDEICVDNHISAAASSRSTKARNFYRQLQSPKLHDNLLFLSPLFQGSARINQLAWSPDGQILASGSNDKGVLLWDRETRKLLDESPKGSWMRCIAWSPDGQFLASGSDDRTVRCWDRETGKTIQSLQGHSGVVRSVAWSPDGQFLASGSDDNTIRLWDIKNGKLLNTFTGHASVVNTVAWSPDGQILASGSSDHTIRLWNPKSRRQMDILEGHTDFVICISFSSFGQLLASKSHDGTVRLWHPGTWETVAIFDVSSSNRWNPGLSFHPTEPLLTTLSEDDMAVNFWGLDLNTVLFSPSVTPSTHYTNAKVVLVGDSGVGKSGLGLVLTSKPFIPTESTHGRYVWTFANWEVKHANRFKKTYEILLWDLAGQPGYRLIHQLHLNEVAVALILFDAHSETDPFAGVTYWHRALCLVQRIQGLSTLPMKKFLVAARTDRGGKIVSQDRIKSMVHELGFDGFFETSAKEGWGIAELAEAIKKAIDWEALPQVRSTVLFQEIKNFLIAEKEAGRFLTTTDDLYRLFLKTEKGFIQTEGLRSLFETCIGLVEARGLLRRLSFGNLILLQPEVLDAYASALINSVKDEPDGLGSVTEKRVRTADFSIPKDERLKDREQEKLLLIAMIEDLLQHEIALREEAFLIFPSQSTREAPNLPIPERRNVIFRFEGPVLNIYATLVVRLSHSELFIKKELWKNAVSFTSKARGGGIYGVFLDNIGEGLGELTLFMNEEASEEIFFHLEEFVHTHLQRRALPESIERRRIFVCSNRKCRTPYTDAQVTRRRQAGYDWIQCSVCETRISLLDREERIMGESRSLVPDMDRAADKERESAVAISISQGMQFTKEHRTFDVFLCHNVEDKSRVMKIGEQLKEYGISPWLDVWELQPGLPWQSILEQHIEKIKSAAVFVGKGGIGPWQRQELEAFLREFIKRGCPVIPVLLEDAPTEPELPIFLKGMTWVNFRQEYPDPIKQLLWGITGTRTES